MSAEYGPKQLLSRITRVCTYAEAVKERADELLSCDPGDADTFRRRLGALTDDHAALTDALKRLQQHHDRLTGNSREASDA